MAKIDPLILAHLEWIGFIQPTGLVVSAPALVRAGAILDRRDSEGQKLLRECLREKIFLNEREPSSYLPDFREFAQKVLGWSFSPKGYAGVSENPIPAELEVPLPDYGETLRPDFAVRELDPQNGRLPWQLVVRVLDPGQDFDKVLSHSGKLEASPHGRMERLVRQTGVPAGLLFNGRALRLISAPRGESSGWMDFRVTDMIQTAGRPISTALRLLLGQTRLLALPRQQRLTALLEDSRKFQNEVSERLAEQVLHALYEFLRGFQAAHDASKGELLREPLAEHPNEMYRALLTVILRLVFLLYAEERDMLPEDETFVRYYSIAGIYDRLREDAALYPDTMDQRFGAWAQLLVLFRMIFDGAECDAMSLPRRDGVLFDPDRFPFLEGRPSAGARQIHERIEPPLVPDGTIYRALEKLLILDGERISYRALDVEQIGSVYQGMMGFRLETATGRSVAVKAQKKWAAPTTVDLEALRAEPKDKREKWLQERTDRKFAESVKKTVKEAQTVDDLHAALQSIIDQGATPDLVPKGAMILQPSEERRRSGSHYTPRALTEPIVRTTLEPILRRLRGENGRAPEPEQILDLKVCDPAIGSGAFLVEACRQLGDALIESWHAHGKKPEIPPDEDETIFARRLIAQRCLYGVDRNPVAVDLAKMSLWLATLARDHALTFVDHALRHGDSLVGFSRNQIEALHWDPSKPILKGLGVHEALAKETELRQKIRFADDAITAWELRDLWDEAQFALEKVRLFGDLVIAAFFEDGTSGNAAVSAANAGEDACAPRLKRESIRNKYANDIMNGNVESHREHLKAWRDADLPLVPFHWEMEFPEVFNRESPGFETMVGNPPFGGKNTIISANADSYPDWLKQIHEESHGNSDLVAHFFRRAFNLIRRDGAFGFIATNTIAQGDTRSTGLRWICKHGGEIYSAQKRYKWPGLAAVVVSVLHVLKGSFSGAKLLDNRNVDTITAFLFHRGSHDDLARLAANTDKSFVGSYVLGMGFTFDDTDTKGLATPIVEMHRLIEKDSRNREVIFPYIGGEEVNSSPTQSHYRYVINFRDWQIEKASSYIDCWRIIESKVKPERQRINATGEFVLRDPLPQRFWQYAEKRPGLYEAISGLQRVLVVARVGQHGSFTFLPTGMVLSEQLIVFALHTYAAFCCLQSRCHEIWARFFGSSMKDDLRYTPSDCFETFPFPENWENHHVLESADKAYYEFRAGLMVRNNEGLTKTYNRFHNPNEIDSDILKMRELHTAMDRAVLEAYGWSDIHTDCEFLLDYEIDEEEWGDKKKPYRYRWPDEVRDEVLARLLELNAQRAKEEALTGAANKPAKKAKTKRAVKPSNTGSLF
jgi:hypothetical protein